MRLLITGGAGFIGSAVVRLAIAKGHEVLVLDSLTYAANLANLASVAKAKSYRFEQADIRDRAALTRIFDSFRPSAVMHLAAESHVDRSIDGPGAFIDTNITGTFQLLEAARHYYDGLDRSAQAAFRFHHISTDEVFGSLGPTGKFSESSAYAPNSPYAASKAASDHLVRAWSATYGLPVLISNCSNNYGPYQFPEKLIPVIILKALAGQKIPIYGQGAHIRDWLHVEDHAEALLLILARGQPGETYGVGGNAEMQNIEIAKMICALMNETIPAARPYQDQITLVKDRPGHDARYAIDAGKLQSELGWQPRYDLKEGLRQTVDWYLNNREWWQDILAGDGQMERLGLKRGR